MTHLSPGIGRIDPYPFEELDRRAEVAAEQRCALLREAAMEENLHAASPT